MPDKGVGVQVPPPTRTPPPPTRFSQISRDTVDRCRPFPAERTGVGCASRDSLRAIWRCSGRGPAEVVQSNATVPVGLLERDEPVLEEFHEGRPAHPEEVDSSSWSRSSGGRTRSSSRPRSTAGGSVGGHGVGQRPKRELKSRETKAPRAWRPRVMRRLRGRQRRGEELVGEGLRQPGLVPLGLPASVDDQEPVELGRQEGMDDVGGVALAHPGP